MGSPGDLSVYIRHEGDRVYHHDFLYPCENRIVMESVNLSDDQLRVVLAVEAEEPLTPDPDDGVAVVVLVIR